MCPGDRPAIGEPVNPAARSAPLPRVVTLGHSARQWFQLDRALLDPHHPNHERWMRDALDTAAVAGAGGDVPVGAVVVDAAGRAIARAENRKQRDGDPTAHAEILALRAAGRSRGNWHLNDCALYVTLEPCPMCAGALVQARLGLLVYGAGDPKTGAIATVGQLAAQPWSNHQFPAIAGVLEADCRDRLQAWFDRRRSSPG